MVRSSVSQPCRAVCHVLRSALTCLQCKTALVRRSKLPGGCSKPKQSVCTHVEHVQGHLC